MITMRIQRYDVEMTVFRCPAGHWSHLMRLEGLFGKEGDFGEKVLRGIVIACQIFAGLLD